MAFPVSVIIPHKKSRGEWFKGKCLPSVRMNDPAEIIVEDWEGGACEKRNAGAAKATQPFLFFVDDDAILYQDSIKKFLSALESDPGASFAYCDTKMVFYPGIPYPFKEEFLCSRPWDPKELRRGNFVDTMSPLRREAFVGFDPSIRRFQDWDFFLTMAERGHRGVHVPEILFESHHFDVGISASVSHEEAVRAVKAKHKIP